MRFLLIHVDYPGFIEWLYSRDTSLQKASWETQITARHESLFFMADYYSRNLRKYGHEAMDVYTNNHYMAKAWAREHGIKLTPTRKWNFRLRKGIVPWAWRSHNEKWRQEVLEAQIKEFKPDVIYNFDVWQDTGFLSAVKKHARMLVGQHAQTKLSEAKDWSCYDLMLSSFPPTIEWFRGKGVKIEMFRLGFDPIVLDRLNDVDKEIPVSFVGSFVFKSRNLLLEEVCRKAGLAAWGTGVENLEPDSPLRLVYKGEAWGTEMFQIFRKSKITLNHHGLSPPYANNMRLFDVTGVGTLLVTDWKENLHEMFEPGKEVVTFRTAEECAEKIKYYLEHDDEREAIAKAGQKRTLDEHTYHQRIGELLSIIEKQ